MESLLSANLWRSVVIERGLGSALLGQLGITVACVLSLSERNVVVGQGYRHPLRLFFGRLNQCNGLSLLLLYACLTGSRWSRGHLYGGFRLRQSSRSTCDLDWVVFFKRSGWSFDRWSHLMVWILTHSITLDPWSRLLLMTDRLSSLFYACVLLFGIGWRLESSQVVFGVFHVNDLRTFGLICCDVVFVVLLLLIVQKWWDSRVLSAISWLTQAWVNRVGPCRSRLLSRRNSIGDKICKLIVWQLLSLVDGLALCHVGWIDKCFAPLTVFVLLQAFLLSLMHSFSQQVFFKHELWLI